ncbi:hypothetical protein [Candidatus Brocadia sapporoensis]|uniref:hypothetical protein n=1 Tax=Candidatus Brocadia sapporoensis TaxID=392547 RepID=UPI001E5F3F0D|nr:hypothetical protein [Candidatus Brocadia sapporoensis]
MIMALIHYCKKRGDRNNNYSKINSIFNFTEAWYALIPRILPDLELRDRLSLRIRK